MSLGVIHTLGDSTLDNRIWVSSSDDCIEEKLARRVQEKGYAVFSHAYDGFTTIEVLKGGRIGGVIQGIPSYHTYLKEKGSGEVRPLETLQAKIPRMPDKIHFVVLSVGGNDFRVNLMNPVKLLWDIPKIQERYLQIVDKLKGLKGRDVRPILMLQYRTDANNDHYGVYTVMKVIASVALVVQVVSFLSFGLARLVWTGTLPIYIGLPLLVLGQASFYFSRQVIQVEKAFSSKSIGIIALGRLMESFYSPILQRAKQERIPLLDLPNTFDPHARLYHSGIEPNEAGGELIARGIEHIVLHHDFNRESMLYSTQAKDTVFAGSKNDPANWKVSA